MNNVANINDQVLTKRQTQCARYLLQGCTAKEMAERLGLSTRTVEYYLFRLKTKLGCKNKVELALALSRLMMDKINN